MLKMALHDLELNSSMRFAKYMLLLVSFLFAITAMLLVMVGSTIQALLGDYSQFLSTKFQSPPTLLVAVGFVLLGVAVLGAYGACKESVLLINMYGLALFGVFLLEVCAAIAAYMMQDDLHQILNTTMTESFAQVQKNEYISDCVDYLQLSLSCCGVTKPSDWISLNNGVVPDSCYPDLERNEYFGEGCLRRLEFIIEQSSMLLATGASTVAFVQLLGVICAFMLAKTLRRNKSLRLARRWQMQQNLGILTTMEKCPTEPSIGVGTHGSDGYQQLETAGAHADHSCEA